MDSIDAQLLRILAEDARCSATDISKKVNLSIPAVNKRISRLRENGIIERFTIQLNPQKINSSVQAFVLLVVDQYSRVNELLEFVNAKENIVDCYAITGEYDCTQGILQNWKASYSNSKEKSVFPRAIRSLC